MQLATEFIVQSVSDKTRVHEIFQLSCSNRVIQLLILCTRLLFTSALLDEVLDVAVAGIRLCVTHHQHTLTHIQQSRIAVTHGATQT